MFSPWILYSLGNAVGSTSFSLTSKKGEEYISPESFTSYYFLISTILLFLYISLKKDKLEISKSPLIAGIFLGLSNIFLNKSIFESANPGLAMGIFRTQSVLTYICAIFLFHSSVNLRRIIGMVLVIIGAFVSSGNKNNKNNKNKETNKSNSLKSKIDDYKWEFFAIIGAILMTFKDIFTKISLSKTSNVMNVPSFMFLSLLSGCVVCFIYKIIVEKSILIKSSKSNTTNKIKDNQYLYVILMGFIFLMYATTVAISTKLAPNPGIPKAIDLFGIVFTLIFSKYLFKNSEISKKQWVGIILLIVGVSTVII